MTSPSTERISRRAAVEKNKEIESVLESHRTRILVVGCGGGGNNTITRLMEIGVNGVETLAINTDAQDLLVTDADDKILIGRNLTKGLGTGGNPKIGEDAACESQKEIEEALRNADMVFVTCGLGGGSGTGAAPIVAASAKQLGALTLAVVTVPFSEEGMRRWENAHTGLEKLRKNSDTVIVIQNDRLLEIVPDMPLGHAFKVADEALVNAVKGITELITAKGLVNLDFADIRTIMQDGGTAMIGIGESDGEDRAKKAVEMAMKNQLLDVDITGAKSALINITGGPEMSLKEARTVMKIVADKLDPAAKLIWGARIDQNLGKSVRVMLIVTSLQEKQRAVVNDGRAASATGRKAPQAKSNGKAPSRKEIDQVPGSDGRAFQPSELGVVLTNRNDGDGALAADTRSLQQLKLKEQSSAHLHTMRMSIGLLLAEPARQEMLRRIKNAALGINDIAHGFALTPIADNADAIQEICGRALNGEFKITRRFVEIFRDMVTNFEGMIHGETEAFAKAQWYQERFLRLMDFFDGKGPPQLETNKNETNYITHTGEVLSTGARTNGSKPVNESPSGQCSKPASEIMEYLDNLYRKG